MTTEIAEGEKAPAFDLPSDGDGTVDLASLKGKTVVLYFYPKDDTSGCTREAIDFSGLKSDFDAAGAVVLGVSPDPIKKHDKFKAKHDLSVTLLSDESTDMLQQWGVWKEKSMYGRKYMGIERSTFVIDGSGVIRADWRKVKVTGHAEAVLEAVKGL